MDIQKLIEEVGNGAFRIGYKIGYCRANPGLDVNADFFNSFYFKKMLNEDIKGFQKKCDEIGKVKCG